MSLNIYNIDNPNTGFAKPPSYRWPTVLGGALLKHTNNRYIILFQPLVPVLPISGLILVWL